MIKPLSPNRSICMGDGGSLTKAEKNIFQSEAQKKRAERKAKKRGFNINKTSEKYGYAPAQKKYLTAEERADMLAKLEQRQKQI